MKTTKGGDLNNKTVCVSGYFSPLHVGHLDLFRKAKRMGGKLIVIVNNDKQQMLKNKKIFMTEDDRAKIVGSLKMVDEAIISIDDDRTVCKTLELVKPDIFVNGGDRTIRNVPETKICNKLGIKMIFGAGKKIRSSSELLSNYAKNKKKVG